MELPLGKLATDLLAELEAKISHEKSEIVKIERIISEMEGAVAGVKLLFDRIQKHAEAAEGNK